MCGICGILFNNGRGAVDSRKLENAVASLQHRGPDDSGMYIDNIIGLGFRRLSIIDLSSAGHQPMGNEDNSIQLVLNGEIYNFLDLKEKLLVKGHKFRSKSDSEVIIHAYEEWGVECLDKIDGMFAFAIWDSKDRSLFLAIDRFGIKPLYYKIGDGVFAFGSEIKAILNIDKINKEIDYSALSNYFSLLSVPAPQTIYKNIHRLLPAHAMKVKENGDRKIWKYWRLNLIEDTRINENEWIERIDAAFNESIRKHLVSDVPIAVLLSGGVDSSAVVAYASKLMNNPVKTFSVSFRGETNYDESEYQKIISDKFHTDHTEFNANLDIMDTAEKLITESDGPYAVYSGLPLYHICKEVSNHTKVVLTGDGGDEVFAGYDIRYKVLELLKYFDLIPNYGIKCAYKYLNKSYYLGFNYNLSRLRRFSLYALQNLDNRYLTFMSIIDDNQKENIFNPDLYNTTKNNTINFFKEYFLQCPEHGLNRYIYFDYLTLLTNEMLTKVDRCTSMVGIEGRVPFLDKDLVELAFQIPLSLKVSKPRSFINLINSLDNKGGKLILKKTFKDILPRKVMYRSKSGFSVPLEKWLKSYDLESIAIEKDDIVNYDYYLKLVKAFRNGQTHLSNQIWVFINYYIWKQRCSK